MTQVPKAQKNQGQGLANDVFFFETYQYQIYIRKKPRLITLVIYGITYIYGIGSLPIHTYVPICRPRS